jgi:hypothetical protein
MSEAMVRHYARDVNKSRLTVNGMRKLEQHRPAILPMQGRPSEP